MIILVKYGLFKITILCDILVIYMQYCVDYCIIAKYNIIRINRMIKKCNILIQ